MPEENKDNEKKEASALPRQDGNKPQPSVKAPDTPQKDDKELEPVITHEEFDNLEKTEQKKKLLGFLKSLKKDKTGEDSKSQTQSELEKKLNEVMLKTEKLEGKLEIFQSSKSESGERIANLAEEVGELRSMIFSKEDTFAKIEDEFEKIKESTAHMKPEKIHRDLEEHAAEVMKVQAELELHKSRISNTEKLIEKTEKILDKFKSYENLLDISKEIKKQVEKISDSEKYTSRMAAKTEKIFAELDDRLTEFRKYTKEIDDMNEMLKDTIKSIDSLEIKTESRMTKESFSKIKQEQDNKTAEQDTRIKTLKDIVGAIVDKISTHGVNISSQDLETIKTSVHEDILRELENRVPHDIDKKISQLATQNDDLDAKLSQFVNSRLKPAQIPAKGTSEISALHEEKSRIITQIDNLNPPAININRPRDIPIIQPSSTQIYEQPDHPNPATPNIQNIPGQPKETPPSTWEHVPSKLSPQQQDIDKVKNIFKKTEPVQLQSQETPASPLLSQNLQNSPQYPKETDSENLKDSLKESIQQNKMLGEDLKSEISRLKDLYKEKQSIIENKRSTGKEYSAQQILLDNASLDLGMAELEFLDGDETLSRQKIEKVSTVLENI